MQDARASGRINGDRLLGIACLAFAGALLGLWIPLDVETGIVELERGARRIGDALAPVVAGVLLGVAGALLVAESRRGARGAGEWRAPLQFALLLVLVFTLTMALFRWAGPVAVGAASGLADGALPEYRLLRDTAPWKYIGYWCGGAFMIFSLITLAERKVSLRAALIALAAPPLIALGYDLPFDDLLLPPNGDV